MVHLRKFELKRIVFKKMISALLFLVSHVSDRDCHDLNIVKRAVHFFKNSFFGGHSKSRGRNLTR